jgi:hypothetical protein
MATLTQRAPIAADANMMAGFDADQAGWAILGAL